MNRSAVDTNILLRSIVRDDPEQTPKARAYFSAQRQAGVMVYINLIVLVETVWALRQIYKYPKIEILAIVQGFLNTSGIELQESELVEKAIGYYRNSNADFSDCLILVRNQKANVADTKTFDKKAAKLPGFSLLD
jgi:predicted nucleic-acid-binding protein